MDHQRFDALARGWATRKSRRTTLKALTGAAGGILGLAGLGDAAAKGKGCKRTGKHCKKDGQCCAGLVCEAQQCQAETVKKVCESDLDCPIYLQRDCGIINPLPWVVNRCLDGFCLLSSRPPEDPCCTCGLGRACDVSEDNRCCALEQVCRDKKGNEFCCPGTDYCGTDKHGRDICRSSNRACTSDDTGNCFPEESCAGSVCCPPERACPEGCCDFDCVCGENGLCMCGVQAGIRRI